MRLESEVSRVKERNPRALDILLERLCASRQEERIPVAPDGEQWRLVLAKVPLERRIHFDVARVVEKKIQLYVVRTRSSHVVVVQVVAVRRNQRRVLDAAGV